MKTQDITHAHPVAATEPSPNADLAAALHEAAHRLSFLDEAGPSSDEPAQLASATVRRFLTSLEQGDLVAVADVVCDDVVYRIPGQSRIAGVYEGIDGIIAACSIAPRPGAAELHSELTDLIPAASGEYVATFHAMKGMLDGESLDIDIAIRFTLRHGRIAAITEYSSNQYAADDLFGGCV